MRTGTVVLAPDVSLTSLVLCMINCGGRRIKKRDRIMSSDLPPQPPSAADSDSVTPVPGQPIPPVPGSTGLAPNIAAGLAALFTLLGGIIFLLIEKRDRYVRFWAMQSVLFGLVWFAFQILTEIVYFIFRGPIHFVATIWGVFAWLIGVAFLIVYIVMIVQAFSGKEWEIPVLGKLARQQAPKILP